ncbi:MAG TPA: ThiF family adenylyltransferase [Acidimicrobiales bacterium]|nr:ThiF family adenylyltransferase [Acidimicrobiales bacterium]
MRVLFCGVGALGSHAATACRNAAVELVLLDGDRVESKNLRSQAFVRQSVGRNKAEALRLQLSNFYGVRAGALPVRLGTSNIATLGKGADLIVDCFDNAASRRLLSSYAEDERIPLVHGGISADGEFGLVRWDERFTADEEDTAGQATCDDGDHLPMILAVSAVLAQVVQEFAERGERRDVMVSRHATTTTWRQAAP